jgi:large subunit ribosomal protein L10e
MGLRPGRTMREPRRAWTRTARRIVKRAYVVGIPQAKLRMFGMGNPNLNHEIVLHLATTQKVQIRDNALEAARVAANKYFEKTIGIENYFFQIRVYPHQCLREHVALTGAGADRLSEGMRLAFGRPCGRAVLAKKNQKIMSVYAIKKFEEQAKHGLELGARKMPGHCVIVQGMAKA